MEVEFPLIPWGLQRLSPVFLSAIFQNNYDMFLYGSNEGTND